MRHLAEIPVELGSPLFFCSPLSLRGDLPGKDAEAISVGRMRSPRFSQNDRKQTNKIFEKKMEDPLTRRRGVTYSG